MATRRMILVNGAASIVILGAGALGYRALKADLTEARAPWREAGQSFGDIRLDALSYAVLAPNPHNRQPWLVRLDGTDRLTLFCDLDRLLPQTDPLNRQIVIGLGAFLEILRMAAAQLGQRLVVSPFPEGEPQPVLDGRPVANVQFVPDRVISSDPLFDYVPMRRTVRDPFDQAKPVSAELLQSISGDIGAGQGVFSWANDQGSVASLKSLCQQSWLVETTTKRTHDESVDLMRIGKSAVNENPDGISLSGPFVEAMRLTGILSKDALRDPTTQAYKGGLAFYSKAIETAMAFGWLVTQGNSRADQLSAGAGWVRAHLSATKAGLAMHPLSQALQEFPEMEEHLTAIHERLDVSSPARIQGFFRFGYAKFPEPAPRWPLTTRLLPGDSEVAVGNDG